MNHEELGMALLKEKERADLLISLFNSTPDLDRAELKGQYIYASKRVNDVTDSNLIKLWITRDCGCCPDCNYYVYPYCDIEGVEVFASLSRCLIGAGLMHGSGIEPSERRFDRYRDFGYSDTIVKVIEDYLDNSPPIYYSDDDDEDGEDGTD